MIYFAQDESGQGPIKIGYTANMPKRIKLLEHRYGKSFVILATMDGGRDREVEIHTQFDHLRFGRTEQFRPAPELMVFIDQSPDASTNPDAVEIMVPTCLDPGSPYPGKMGRPKSKDGPLRHILGLKGTLEWKAWLLGFANKRGTTMGEILMDGAEELARKEKYPDSPPRRPGKDRPSGKDKEKSP